MKQENVPSAALMREMLDAAPVAIVVRDTGSQALLYANQMAKENGIDGGETYLGKGKIIDWNGRPASIEYWADAAGKEKEAAGENPLLSAFREIPCGLCIYRVEASHFIPVFCNPAFYHILGYSEEKQRKHSQRIFDPEIYPDDLDLLQEKILEALQDSQVFQHTFRVWNNNKQEYRWIRLEGSVKSQKSGETFLYAVFSDVCEQKLLEEELTKASEKMQDIINAIPGGVAIYRVSDVFETIYFSDGVPELTGYTVEEYQTLIQKDAAELTYREDTDMVVSEARKVIETHQVATFEFRKQHRDGHIVWVRVQIRWIGEDGGRPLLHCVFHDISALKEAQLELQHLVNSIPGGIASYRIEKGRFFPTFFSDGVPALTGHTRKELGALCKEDAFGVIYELDRDRVQAAAQSAIESGEVLDIYYRARHNDGHLVWIHLNGRRMGPASDPSRFYAVFTGMSAETHLFQSIANETADGIYVIDKESRDLLYVNESKDFIEGRTDRAGIKCYEALYGRKEPCPLCVLEQYAADGCAHIVERKETNRFHSVRLHETNWNGIPAYVKYVRDVTDEIQTQKEKERLEQYFQSVIKHLPGGVAVVRYEEDGSMTPEFLSDGFAAMTEMTLEDAWRIYRQDAMAGVHPDDQGRVDRQMRQFVANGESNCEITYRLLKGSGGYLWVKNTLSLIQSEGGECRVYAGYHDITKEKEERERLRKQFDERILQHYRTPGPNALVIGHCNITQNIILEIIDHTNSGLLETFGTSREEFFTGLSNLVVDPEERKRFRETYLNEPSLSAYRRKDTELLLKCFIQLPREEKGRYVQFKVNLVETPDTGDITGILTVTDITEQTISDLILHQLSVASYDLVVDVDLLRDHYSVISCDRYGGDIPEEQGVHSEQLAFMLREQVLPKDREHVAHMLDPRYIRERLEQGAYSFSYSIFGEHGEVLTKNLTLSPLDLRLGRVCMARADITESVREQQGLLNVIAYTFELLALIRVDAGQMTLYTRKMVLENLPPFHVEDYNGAVLRLTEYYDQSREREDIIEKFRLETMLKRLREKPVGYDFVLPYQTEDGTRYKQINVLWGDDSHKTVCMVRADVTDMLAAERERKDTLEKALALAEEANQAKSDFLSSMSHDIRTPLNAIIGMNALALAHLDDRSRMEDCLRKIELSSKHLLSLVNDILDMSKIERSKISLNCIEIYLPEMVEQLSAIMLPQAKAAGLHFEIRREKILHQYFYGDALRINQILINILGNAIKFTPEGGSVEFLVEEIPPVKDPEQVRFRFMIRDTGVGMSDEFLSHVFEPFVRNPKMERVEGSGLGLSITKGLVDLMGGTISVESKLHQGTTFQIELEWEAAEGRRFAGPAGTAPQNTDEKKFLAGRRFLVAEDNAINAEILCELLHMHGARTVVKTDGARAFQAFQDAVPGTYDAILMDIQMPVMNGYEACRAIRKLNRKDAETIPIIAMTANAFAEDVQASMDAGMTAHVAKPIDVQVLWSTLDRVLGEQTIGQQP